MDLYAKYKAFSPPTAGWIQTLDLLIISQGFYHCANHRDKTRMQMFTKMFPHLKLLCWLFMGPTLCFDTKQRNCFFDQIWCFLTVKKDSDNIIHS